MRRRRTAVLVVLSLAVLVLGGVSLSAGTPWVSPAALLDLASRPRSTAVVVLQVRLPRWVIAVLAGAALGACGLLLQESLRNPLAAPELLGVGPGAALAVALSVLGGWGVSAAAQPLIAVAGAAVGGVLTLLIARSVRSASGVLLAGAAVGAAVGGLVVAVVSMAEQLQVALLFKYLVGSLAGVSWATAGPAAVWLAALLPVTVLVVPAVGALRMGDEVARALGVRPGRARSQILLLVAVLVAGVVAVAGPIAWIGFLAPHLARRLVPGDTPGGTLPVAMAAGAVATAVADLAARTVFAPVETPVGAWTAVTGVVCGVALLTRSQRGAV